MNRFYTQLSCALFILSSVTAYAQNDNEHYDEQWYQVELLVFAYENSYNASQEIWPPSPRLSYPQRIVELSSALPTEITLNTRDVNLTITDTVIIGDPEAETEALVSATSDVDETLAIEAASPPEVSNTLPQFLVELDQQPFSLLDKEQLNFSRFINRLARQTDIRPLFHGAWRQPIAERSKAESVLIQGGDQFDNHYELEGSVSLGLERYLHIKTDLWLSTFVSNAGRDKNLWAVLPARPITSGQLSSKPVTDPFSTSSNQQLAYTNSQLENPFVELAGNQFSVERTVALQQDRRMRSDELHYIDHPLMGVLIKITPYEFPIEIIDELQDIEPLDDVRPESSIPDN